MTQFAPNRREYTKKQCLSAKQKEKRMKKKVLALVLCLALVTALVIGLVACNDEDEDYDLTVGLICLHDKDSTYDKNFIVAMEEVEKKLNIKVLYKYNVPEEDVCLTEANDLVSQGCDIIFADSFGHEDFIMEAARQNPGVQFCHATGTQAHTAGIDNYHNAFASIYEGRYLAGIAAGMKLAELYGGGDGTEVSAENAKVGYVGAFPYAEVVSGYTAWFLGVRSIVPATTMEVQYTFEWLNEDKERGTADTLMDMGCKLISQHADSMGAPTACEARGIPNVSYNGSTVSECPNTYIISSRINWAPYYEYAIQAVIDANKANAEAKKADTNAQTVKPDIKKDWVGSLSTNSVLLTAINTKVAAAGTQEAIDRVKAELIAGTRQVFDLSTFTVNGETLKSYLADVDDDRTYTKETEVVANGVFEESKYRSAPYFDVRIDGIHEINPTKD